jgi:hypothetical protein
MTRNKCITWKLFKTVIINIHLYECHCECDVHDFVLVSLKNWICSVVCFSHSTKSDKWDSKTKWYKYIYLQLKPGHVQA